VIPLTRTILGRIRGGLRRCAAQIDVYFIFLYSVSLVDNNAWTEWPNGMLVHVDACL